MSIIIDEELCTGCASCMESCIYGAIELDNNIAFVLPNCNLCGACVEVCPEEAISLDRDDVKAQKIDISQFKGVWVVAEHYKKKIHNVSLQLLCKGRELADLLQVNLSLVILGTDFDDKLEEFSLYGMDEIIYIKSPILKDYYSDLYTKVITELVLENKPEIILIGATPTGRDFAPRVAKRLSAGLTADCTGLEINLETRNLLQTRPTYGGAIMATIRTPSSRPQMATVRAGIFKMPEKVKKNVNIRKLEYEFKEKDSVLKIVKVISKTRNSVNLEDAKFIVAGGRGVGSKEKFRIIEELAEVLDAELGGSRITVELNWLDPDRQIGQTGKTVSPKLYIACGISGAIQHLVGMQNSGIIVAINKDPNAPIFNWAHYGIVGDLHEIIPALIEEIKKTKSEQ
ncbi:MAG: electron transfer flavoprotein subunit alpha [Promethearchaeota archaeon Loki_b32]|nr:MAG: electron transfer flavoprotein subunit alpha [Candidatus Lokiarchaeota archaeon Loki_b32]